MTRLTKVRIIRALSRDDRGATAVEYGLSVALIAALIAGAVTALGGQLSSIFGSLAV